MTPDDLIAVDRSWDELRGRRSELVDHLAARFGDIEPGDDAAAARAAWLVEAVSELVGLLVAPSRLGERARELAATWPDAAVGPTFRVEGRAWMCAAAAVCPTWSDLIGEAWCQAWLLLSDVLAAEALSPFADPHEGNPCRQ